MFGPVLWIRVAAVALVVWALWYAKGLYDDSVRAPVIQDLNSARQANTSLEQARLAAEAERDRLNGLLNVRSEREARQEQITREQTNALKQLAAQKPDVKAWSDTPIPADVLRLRDIETSGQGTGQSLRGPNLPNPAASVAAPVVAGSNQRGPVEPKQDAGTAATAMQRPVAGRTNVETVIPPRTRLDALMERLKGMNK